MLIRPLRATGVWLAFLLGEIFTVATILIYVCIKNKKISLSFSSIMVFDENYGDNPGDRLELSIGNSMDEVVY